MFHENICNFKNTQNCGYNAVGNSNGSLDRASYKWKGKTQIFSTFLSCNILGTFFPGRQQIPNKDEHCRFFRNICALSFFFALTFKIKRYFTLGNRRKIFIPLLSVLCICLAKYGNSSGWKSRRNNDHSRKFNWKIKWLLGISRDWSTRHDEGWLWKSRTLSLWITKSSWSRILWQGKNSKHYLPRLWHICTCTKYICRI